MDVIAGWLAVRLGFSLLFGVEPSDATVYASAALMVAGMAGLASIVPIRRAA